MKNSRKKSKVIHPAKFTICRKFFALALLLNIPVSCCAVITDDFAENTLDKNLQIKPYRPQIIEDRFAELNSKKSVRVKIEPPEEVLPVSANIPKIRTAQTYKEDGKPVQISVLQLYSTKQKLEEGAFIGFKTLSEITYGNKTYPAGTIVKGRLETISKNSRWGTPADVIIGNFSIDGKPLYGEISKTGSNRTIWLRPLSIAGGALMGTGFFLMFIKGGHAKIKPEEVFTVYY